MKESIEDAHAEPSVTVMVLEQDDGLLPILVRHLCNRGHACLARTAEVAVFATGGRGRANVGTGLGPRDLADLESGSVDGLVVVEATCRTGRPAVVILTGHRDQFAHLDRRLVKVVPLPIRFGPRQITYEFEAILARQDAA